MHFNCSPVTQQYLNCSAVWNYRVGYYIGYTGPGQGHTKIKNQAIFGDFVAIFAKKQP